MLRHSNEKRFQLRPHPAEERLHQSLAVTGGTGTGDLVRPPAVCSRSPGSNGSWSKRAAVVVAVEGIKQSAVLTDRAALWWWNRHRCPDSSFPGITGKISLLYNLILPLPFLNASYSSSEANSGSRRATSKSMWIPSESFCSSCRRE